MNQCIVNVIEKSVFVTFNKIVKNGCIEVWSMDENISLLTKKEIRDTNSTNLNTNAKKGKYRLEINFDNHQIIKFISIN
jgi:hypothetical protein